MEELALNVVFSLVIFVCIAEYCCFSSQRSSFERLQATIIHIHIHIHMVSAFGERSSSCGSVGLSLLPYTRPTRQEESASISWWICQICQVIYVIMYKKDYKFNHFM